MTNSTEVNPLKPKDIGMDYARNAAETLAAQAREAAGAAAETVKQQGGELLGAAKDIAADARDKLMDQAQTQTKVGADYLDGLAGTIDRVALEVDRNVPFAGDFLRSVSQQVEAAAETVRQGDVTQLVRQAQDFARRQPTASFGIAMLAGFGLVRLLKSAGAPAQDPDETSS